MGLLSLIRRGRYERAGFELYGAAVAAARDPFLYTALQRARHAGRALRHGRPVRVSADPAPEAGTRAGSRPGAGGVRCHVQRHGYQSARDGGRRPVGGPQGPRDVGGVSRPRGGLCDRHGRRRHGCAGRRARAQRLARQTANDGANGASTEGSTTPRYDWFSWPRRRISRRRAWRIWRRGRVSFLSAEEASR